MIYLGDCREVMAGMDVASVDAIVTDPPYGLEFMGKGWDHGVPGVPFWTEAIRVLKPGGHLLAFGGTRTFHRLTVAIEDAGFEIRDCLSWLYGSGFPKSLDVSKAIDKAAGAEREVVGNDAQWIKRVGINHDPSGTYTDKTFGSVGPNGGKITAPATSDAERWDGWGTALKPAWEPVIVARKPICGTVAANVTTYGTGALNVAATRIGTTVETWPASRSYAPGQMQPGHVGETQATGAGPLRRWPANVALDEEAAAQLDAQTGERTSGKIEPWHKASGIPGQSLSGSADGSLNSQHGPSYGDTGGVSRFYYVAKASRSERNAGLEGMPERESRRYGDRSQGPLPQQTPQAAIHMPNVHPCVKPISLMRWLVRLVVPPGGVVLDPFMGSGSTGCAAALEGFEFIGIEQDAEYVAIAERRIAYWITQRPTATQPMLDLVTAAD